MSDNISARVLFVDDDEHASQSQLQGLFERLDLDVRLRPPEEVIHGDIEWADLVVVDYFLTHWPERDAASPARSPQNGLAAISSMRSNLLPPLADRGPGVTPPPAVAFALLSGNLAEATSYLPTQVLAHVFSRENNLEWAFRRDDLTTGDGRWHIALLAHAVRQLPDQWPVQQTDAEAQLFSMLGLTTTEETNSPVTHYWRHDARQDVLACRPPLHELSARSHGLALIRWMLHRILPYPCFLLDDLQLRARLRVDALDGGNAVSGLLLEELSPYSYNGTLSGFGGRRWWRAGIEEWLFSTTEGQSGNPQAVADLALRYGAQRDRAWQRPVVVITGDLARSGTFAEVEDTVRVRPDDWPVFADAAYALRMEALDDPYLRSLVDPPDRYVLEPNTPS